MIAAGNTFTGHHHRNWSAPATTTITGNTVSNSSSSSGIPTSGDGLNLANNGAINNGGYGIYAPNGADQGGNVATEIRSLLNKPRPVSVRRR